MKVAILSIGDEVVIGKTVNTNAATISRILQDKHFIVTNHLSVRDTYEEIEQAFKYLFMNANCIITTGGLGPTVDDITKEAVGKFFNQEFIFSEKEYKNTQSYFKNIVMPEVNRKQAYFLKDSIIIENNNGTAPGMLFEINNQMVINLPGPPKEMEPMFNEFVIPFLEKRVHTTNIEKRYRLMNIGESHAETILKSLYSKYPSIKIAPYASVGVVDYILSTNSKEDGELLIELSKQFEDLMKDFIIGDTSKEINEIIVDLLIEKKLTLGIAESCTGGMISSYIVDVPGCSHVFLEGLVTYSNESKENRLHVSHDTIYEYGAVSEQTAIEMAKGMVLNGLTDIGISTTGIAGPTGGTDEKPVGLVYTAIYFKDQVKVFKNNYGGDRYKIRQRTMMGLLFQLFSFIKTL